MKHKVESQYKDPDRYVERLKSRIAWVEKQRDLARARHGDYLFRYDSTSTQRFGVDDCDFGACRTGQRLIVDGRICHVEENCESSNVLIDQIIFRRCDHD